MMDKTGTAGAFSGAGAGLLSRQVTDGRYFFLELASGRRRTGALAFGGCERCRPDYAVRRASFAYYGLEYVAEGAGTVVLDGRRQGLGAGAVFAYGPETAVEIRTDPGLPMVKYFLCFVGAAAGARLTRAGVPAGRVRPVAAHGEVRSAFEELIREGQWHGPLTREICAALGELLLLKIEAARRAHAAADPARTSFVRCKALIESNLERLVSLEDIAAAARLDVSTVCRLFRRFQGTSPYQHLLRRKMSLAAEFLMETGGSVKAAAARVGFADPYHFSRVFKAVHGVAPSSLATFARRSAGDRRPAPERAGWVREIAG